VLNSCFPYAEAYILDEFTDIAISRARCNSPDALRLVAPGSSLKSVGGTPGILSANSTHFGRDGLVYKPASTIVAASITAVMRRSFLTKNLRQLYVSLMTIVVQ
jgi:hypothetical protein